MKNFCVYIIIFFGIFLISCEKENSISEYKKPTGQEYFPLETGNVLVYEITDIIIDKQSEYYDTTKYFLQEIIDMPFVDNEGDTAYRIERYRKYTQESQWVIHQVWSAKLTEKTAEKVEDNHRIVKMRFPIKLNMSWDGNIFNELRPVNSIEDSLYRIVDVNYLFTGEYQNFDSCAKIRHYYNESLINKDHEYEIYAPNIGLVYKEKTHIDSQENISIDIPIEERATTARFFKQKLIEFYKI